MGAPYYYYVYPFGENADDVPATIPTSAAGDGSMSYFAGFTPPYEYDLLTNPAALPIPRNQFNQLMLDVTNNIQEYQQYGSPQFVTSGQNLGSPLPYPIYARVYYSGEVYENQVAANTATPGTDSTWLKISGNVSGVPIGAMLDFGGVTAPANYLLCDGSAISRTTYASLKSAITFTQNGTTTNTVNTLTGLSSTANMYVGMPLEGTGIPAGTTVASITNSTDIVMSANATASATVAVTFYPWGNGDGSTTFNAPDSRRRSSIGSGGTGTAIVGSIVGESGGEEKHTMTTAELVAHHHTSSSGGNFITTNPGSATTTGSATWSAEPNTGQTGSSTPFNVYHPVMVVTKIIRYQ